jgi:hypothetical protein
MRSRSFRCRIGAVAPVLSVAEYRLIRPAVPVYPGRQDMPPAHPRPDYVPVNAHYVNPNGRPSQRRHVALLLAALMLAAALLVGAMLLLTSWRAEHPERAPEPGFTTMPAVAVPTTYGPPPVVIR